MSKKTNTKSGLSRRKFIGTTATAAAAFSMIPAGFASALVSPRKPNSRFGGVQIGAITYSWRSMPSTAQDILDYCVEAGISSIELMGNVVEEFAGIPPMPPRPPREAHENEQALYRQKAEVAQSKQRNWRLSASMKKYVELRKMFNAAGVNIHIVKFSPAKWSEGEIDYAFKAAKTLGAKGISNEIGHEACARLGKFAERHNMYAIFHNHLQPGEPGFSFDEFLSYSSKNMLNFDVGHYWGATGKHPNEVIEKFHNRIFSLHLKDKTGKNTNPANTNMPWGEGDTPIADILQLIQKNKWPIYCDIELEYPVPEDSNAQKEIINCVEYCKNILA
ncbi:sugar phosphate isomerase/epimerase [Mariniphaga sediminis]|uniref:Sugar phosphate isomerase/epimerase n=1 Tax=Mariniphaga sediminis TaxID=1628158 RepID=A0A399CY28_9BACT|nr:sugar phosphate isomerase/epimerase [Mariniphaga sediminis]RIH64257.1 sugar phosphate isomerase/epimerase [Mariniphaga sediminis]RIH66536.1 sugar phosphate isomerase/epimerase [Mariniphaga sediminis]